MTQEEKLLLLQELSARLSYGVICSTSKGNGYLCSINQTIFGNEYGINIKATERDYFNDNECDIKPYLRLMSSMTEEEEKEFEKIFELELKALEAPEGHTIVSAASSTFEIDFYNKHHFDYRGLIERGLAIAVTEDNNPYK